MAKPTQSQDMLSPRVVFIEGTICLLRALLNFIDFVLLALESVMKQLSLVGNGGGPEKSDKPWVCIVGASFAGLAVHRELSHHTDELDLTVVDMKSYFEYTPGILRCYVEPSYLKELTFPLRNALESGGGNSTLFVRGEVVAVEASDTSGEVKLRSGQKVPYEYLVLAAGSTYEGVAKPSAEEITLSQRQEQIDRAASELEMASTVIIIGAGAVGVELAGEILTKYPHGSKRVIMVDAASTICPGFLEASTNYARRWLEDNGAELMLGCPLKDIGERSVTLADGTVVRGLVYKCFGASPNSTLLSNEQVEGKETSAWVLDPKTGRVLVNDHLQVTGSNHIFCAGDLCHHASTNEWKLGHTAEVNAHLVAENVLRLVHSSRQTVEDASGEKSLLKYPHGVVGAATTPKIYILSLGKYDATLGFNWLVVNGVVAAILKWLIEWTKVAAAAERPVGVLFWNVADTVSNFLARTVLLPPTKVTESLAQSDKKSS